jgi:hypothetical protein
LVVNVLILRADAGFMVVQIAVGTGGMVLLLVAFVLNLTGRTEEDTVLYNALNLLGAVLLIVYAYWLASWPFLVLETVWAAAAGHKLWTIR